MKIILVERRDKASNDMNHWFSHIIAECLAKLLIRAKISADFTLALFFLSGLSSIIVFLNASEIIHYIFAYALWRLQIILDMADGHVARYFNTISPKGQYWDRLAHMIINPILLAVLVNSVLKYSDYRNIIVLITFCAVYLQLAVKYVGNVPQESRRIRLKQTRSRLVQFTLILFLDLLSIEGQIICLSICSFLDVSLGIRYFCVGYLIVYYLLTGLYRFVMISKALSQ